MIQFQELVPVLRYSQDGHFLPGYVVIMLPSVCVVAQTHSVEKEGIVCLIPMDLPVDQELKMAAKHGRGRELLRKLVTGNLPLYAAQKILEGSILEVPKEFLEGPLVPVFGSQNGNSGFFRMEDGRPFFITIEEAGSVMKFRWIDQSIMDYRNSILIGYVCTSCMEEFSHGNNEACESALVFRGGG
jgi:hypothetical protein